MLAKDQPDCSALPDRRKCKGRAFRGCEEKDEDEDGWVKMLGRSSSVDTVDRWCSRKNPTRDPWGPELGALLHGFTELCG